MKPFLVFVTASICVAYMVSSPSGISASAWCEDCYEWSGEVCGPGQPSGGSGCIWGDAMCCIRGAGLCEQFASDSEWSLVISNSSNCRVEWSEVIEEYLCAGTSNYCSAGGGGGGGWLGQHRGGVAAGRVADFPS